MACDSNWAAEPAKPCTKTMGLMFAGALITPGVQAGKKVTTSNKTDSRPQNLFFKFLPP
jgi:hypothetical protein